MRSVETWLRLRQRSAPRALGALVFALLLLGGRETAFAAGLQCELSSERPPSEIVVPLGEAGDPRFPAQAIKIVPGESFCVTGTLDEAGEVSNLRLVEPGEVGTGPVIEIRLERDQALRLSIRHSGKVWLYYRAMRLVTQQDLAFPAANRPVGPDALVFEEFGDDVRNLLLFGFRWGPAPKLPRERRGPRQTRDLSVMNASVTFGFWGGERGLQLDELNALLLRDGYTPFPRSIVQGGLDLDFTIGRVRAGVTLGGGGASAQHRSTSSEVSARHAEIGFTLGYDVIRYGDFHVFASTGIIIETFSVDRASGFSLFDEVQPWEGESALFLTSALPFEIGTDYFVPFGRASPSERWIFQFGTRVGWLEQPGDGGWSTGGDNERDFTGPDVDLSGLRGRLVLGIGVQNGW